MKRGFSLTPPKIHEVVSQRLIATVSPKKLNSQSEPISTFDQTNEAPSTHPVEQKNVEQDNEEMNQSSNFTYIRYDDMPPVEYI